jgi:hypothetical protein
VDGQWGQRPRAASGMCKGLYVREAEDTTTKEHKSNERVDHCSHMRRYSDSSHMRH